MAKSLLFRAKEGGKYDEDCESPERKDWLAPPRAGTTTHKEKSTNTRKTECYLSSSRRSIAHVLTQGVHHHQSAQGEKVRKFEDVSERKKGR